MERLIANRLRWWLEDSDLYRKFQSGFRKRRSCQNHRRNSQSAINNKQFTLSVMIDLEKAIDLVWHKGILYKIKQVGLPGIVFKFVEDFLKNPSIQVRIGAAMSSTYFLECNTLGQCAQPTTLHHRDQRLARIVNRRQTRTVHGHQFDVKIWSSLSVLSRGIQRYPAETAKFFEEWGFKILINKAVEILYLSKQTHPDR